MTLAKTLLPPRLLPLICMLVPLWSSAAEPPVAPDSGADSDQQVVRIVDFMRFEPVEITIRAGQTVTWINQDGSNHKIQFTDSISPRLRHDAQYSKQFTTPGSYDYLCAIHGDKMSGKVIVQ